MIKTEHCIRGITLDVVKEKKLIGILNSNTTNSISYNIEGNPNSWKSETDIYYTR